MVHRHAGRQNTHPLHGAPVSVPICGKEGFIYGRDQTKDLELREDHLDIAKVSSV